MNLRANAIRHESGPSQSHYAQYVAANADPANNVGVNVEDLIGRGESLTEQQFEQQVDAVILTKRTAIGTATDSPEPFGAELDAAGVFQGYVNYATYIGCHP